MAIYVGTNTNENGSSADATSATFSHDGTNGELLIVRVALRGNGAQVTGVTATYNGVSMTKQVERVHTISPWGYVAIFTLASPAQGSNNVVVSWTTSAWFVIAATNIVGGDWRNDNSNGDATATASIDMTTESEDLVLDVVGVFAVSITITVGAGQTSQFNLSNSVNLRAGGSYEKATGATTTMSWALSGAASHSSAGIVLMPRPARSGAAISPFYVT